MIDAKELRMGNYVFANGHPFKIIGLLFDLEKEDIILDEGAYARGTSVNNIDPIPIIPEWLERFGINHSGYFMDEQHFDLPGLDDIRVVLSKTPNGSLRISVEVAWELGFPIASPDYIHQLQNLYHALTHVELTVKTLQP